MMVIHVDGTRVCIENYQPFVQGTVGLQANVQLSEEWDGLTVTAVFATADNFDTRYPVSAGSGTITIPWEVLSEARAYPLLSFDGRDSGGNLIRRSSICDLGEVAPSMDPLGETPTPTPPYPDWYENVYEAGQQALQSAQDAEAYAKGTRGGTEVGTTDPAYHNNAKYFKEQAEAVRDSIPADYTELAGDVSELKSALEFVDVPNLITTDKFRDNNYQNIIIVNPEEKTMVVNGCVSTANTETFLYTKRAAANHFAFEAGKRYFAFAEVTFGAAQTSLPYSRVRIQVTKDGDTSVNQYFGDGELVAFDIGRTVNLYGEITSPVNKTGYLRLVFDGMGTAVNSYDFAVSKVFFCEIPNSLTAHALYSALLKLENPIESALVSALMSGEEYDCDLLCWGDSLTAGAGGSGVSYPYVCAAELGGLSMLNCGVGGENCQTIAARQGGNNIVIPAGAVNGVYSTLSDIFGNEIAPLLQSGGAGSGASLIINGQECSLSYASGTGYTISGYAGDALAVPTIARFVGSDFNGKIVTLFIGTNGGSFPGFSAGVDIRIAWLKSMIARIGHDRYVVLGLTVGEETAAFYINEENLMKQAFGNKYFPTRKYLIESGLAIAGITPTEQDTTDISEGKVPTSLKSDTVHLNAAGYTAVGKLLANKIRSLGYV